MKFRISELLPIPRTIFPSFTPNNQEENCKIVKNTFWEMHRLHWMLTHSPRCFYIELYKPIQLSKIQWWKCIHFSQWRQKLATLKMCHMFNIECKPKYWYRNQKASNQCIYVIFWVMSLDFKSCRVLLWLK